VRNANIRDADVSEIGQLARLWFDGWQDAHARIVPAELARMRTPQSFEQRLRAAAVHVRVAEQAGAPVGFYLLKGAELYQFYVSSNARGSGIAAILMADAEMRLRETDVHTAWLACAIGNDRAARFYEKCGWSRTGTVTDDVEVPGGTFALKVWRYGASWTTRPSRDGCVTEWSRGASCKVMLAHAALVRAFLDKRPRNSR
jgi:GNAT superfamily N-acetyltransferase